MILRELQLANDSRKAQYSSIESIKGSVTSLNSRMGSVEDSLTKFAPTIEEFINIKAKVIGAGRLGKWLWIVGGVLLTAAYKFHAEFLNWLGR